MVASIMDKLEHPNGMNMRFWPVQAGSYAAWYAQPFFRLVNEWVKRRNLLQTGNLQAPKNPANNNLPFEFIEYVPLLSNQNLFKWRLEQLQLEREYNINLLFSLFPHDVASYLENRSPEQADRHETLFADTLDFIHTLLAFDSGLSQSRMMAIASRFSCVELGSLLRNPNIRPEIMARHKWLFPSEGLESKCGNTVRSMLIEMSDICHERSRDIKRSFWADQSYNSGHGALLFNSGSSFRTFDPRPQDAQAAAVSK